MATNKQAYTRYRILDNCLSNNQRHYTFDDLLSTINKELVEIKGVDESISVRTLRADLKYLRSPEGGNAPIETYKIGKATYYKYEDDNFKLFNQGLNAGDVVQLQKAIETLSKIEGLPQMGWVQELSTKLEETFFIESSNQVIMSHDNNRYLKGIENLGTLFNAILYKRALKVNYKSFKTDNETTFKLSPYHLREYNNRWFLFGRNQIFPNLTNLALDRIISIEESDQPFIENNIWDFKEYFDDIIGVSFSSKEIENITIKFSNEAAPYILSKPLHGSQRKLKHTEEGLIIRIDVIPNYELETLILSYGENANVLSPKSFRNKIEDRIMKMSQNYLNPITSITALDPK